MTRRRTRAVQTQGNSLLAFIDVLSNGVGACILLFLVFGAIETVVEAGAAPSNLIKFDVFHDNPQHRLVLHVRYENPSGHVNQIVELVPRSDPASTRCSGQSVEVGTTANSVYPAAVTVPPITAVTRCGARTPPGSSAVRENVISHVFIAAPPGVCAELRVGLIERSDDGDLKQVMPEISYRIESGEEMKLDWDREQDASLVFLERFYLMNDGTTNRCSPQNAA